MYEDDENDGYDENKIPTDSTDISEEVSDDFIKKMNSLIKSKKK